MTDTEISCTTGEHQSSVASLVSVNIGGSGVAKQVCFILRLPLFAFAVYWPVRYVLVSFPVFPYVLYGYIKLKQEDV